MLLWKERPVAQSGHGKHPPPPLVSTQFQAFIKTCGNFAGTFVLVKLYLLSLYLHIQYIVMFLCMYIFFTLFIFLNTKTQFNFK